MNRKCGNKKNTKLQATKWAVILINLNTVNTGKDSI